MCELYTSYADTLSNVAVSVHDTAGCTYAVQHAASHADSLFAVQSVMGSSWLWQLRPFLVYNRSHVIDEARWQYDEACCTAADNTFSFFCNFCFVNRSELSTKSRMIWSTSLPWNPTSVNLVASTCANRDFIPYANKMTHTCCESLLLGIYSQGLRNNTS